jgi:cellulose synthase/poly-beta-1,6-N-acetylglucosamine synthase-like glycosyltransferase
MKTFSLNWVASGVSVGLWFRTNTGMAGAMGIAGAIWIGIAVGLVIDSLMRFALLSLRVIRKDSSASSFNERETTKTGNGAVILIASHNEAGIIGPTVADLRKHLDYWQGSRIWVVADRCEDATAMEAACAGARVAERKEGPAGKCAVLSWWLQSYSREWKQADAIVILDADSRMGDGSFARLRRAMQNPEIDVAQCFVAPEASSQAGRLAGWSEVLMQRIDDEARRGCGWPVPLRGTGMAFRGSVLAELAPRLHTLAEDLELDVLLAAAGCRVAFVPDAVVLDPKPVKTAGASRQRARWLQGQWQVLRSYSREILYSLALHGPGAWFLLLLLFMRPKVVFLGLRVFCLPLGFFIPGPFQIILLMGVFLDLLYYLAGAAFVDAPQRYLRDLLSAPRYLGLWMYSLGITAFQQMFRRGQRVWLRAGRQMQ